MTTKNQQELRTLVRGLYDVQKLRIQMGNRIVQNFKAKLGQAPSAPEAEIEQEGKEVLEVLRLSYQRITDGIATFPTPKQAEKLFTGDEVISSYTELVLISQYIAIERDEKHHFSRLAYVLNEFPIYTEFLEKVKGCGPAMSGVIISEIDISKAQYPSSLWKLAGLDTGPDGKGRSRRQEHLVDREYVAKDGTTKTKKSITFNPFLKTKLIGVLGPAFLKAQKNNPYAQIYYNYKHRYENHAVYKDSTKAHRHNMAIRAMVKLFLIDLHSNWRKLEGLPVTAPYHEAKLGIVHHAA